MSRLIRRFKSRLRKRWQADKLVYLTVAIVFVFTAGFIIERSKMEANYSELLSVIAEGESRGNYNAYYGHAQNTKIKFTDMTIEEVLSWQYHYVKQGSPSNAVGKYQFIRPTLKGLIEELGIDSQSEFGPALQDRLAIHLLKRRGVEQYLRGRITREELAHNLSKEWAALPRVVGTNPQSSYYAGDGLNHVQVSVDQVLAAIETVRKPKNS